MWFGRVCQDEREEVLNIYKSLVGSKYCVWSEQYPSECEIDSDMSRRALFCVKNDDGKIIGVVSIDDDAEVEALECWSDTFVPAAELSRVGVIEKYQNQGIARWMLTNMMSELIKQGYKSVHLLVAKDNVKALKSYSKLGFDIKGECCMFGNDYWCYEKSL